MYMCVYCVCICVCMYVVDMNINDHDDYDDDDNESVGATKLAEINLSSELKQDVNANDANSLILDCYSSSELTALVEKKKEQEQADRLNHIPASELSLQEIRLMLARKEAAERKKLQIARARLRFDKHLNCITDHKNPEVSYKLKVTRTLIDYYYALNHTEPPSYDQEFKQLHLSIPQNQEETFTFLIQNIIDTYTLLGVSGNELETIREKHKKRKVEHADNDTDTLGE